MKQKQRKNIRKNRSGSNILTICFLMTGLGLLVYFFMINFVIPSPHSIPPSLEESLERAESLESSFEEEVDFLPEEPVEYPTDKLFVTKGRNEYQDEEMILRVPRLNVVAPVWDGTELETMANGVCLFDYAQLPGKGNYNVSMIAHRNMEFEYIDTIKEGDLIYLQYKGVEYVYEYEETKIVANDDWSIIYCSDYPIVTLLSCHPRHSSKYRMAVIARFVRGRKLEIAVKNENPMIQ